MFDAQPVLVQDPENQRHARDDTNHAAASALREEERNDHRHDDTDDRACVSQTRAPAYHHGEHWNQVAKVLEVIEKRVPTAELPASPRCGPTLLAQVVDHLEDVEVARDGEVQHAEQEAGDGKREVSVDRELLRRRANQHGGYSP